MNKRNLWLKLLVVATFVLGAFGLASCDLAEMFHSHSWQAWVVDTEATCETDGLKHRKCTSCGETEEMPLHKLGHDIEEYVYNEDATCLENGTKSGTCARESCQKHITVEASNTKLSHTFVQLALEGFQKKDATCTSKAVYYRSCSVCGTADDETFEYGDMLPHVYDREIADDTFLMSAVQCEGTYYYKSCKCGARAESDHDTFLDTQSVEHLWGKGELTKKPSEDKKEDGEIHFECGGCDAKEDRPMKPDDDEDGDGLSNWEECWEHDCDPMNKDTDDDKLDDGEEVKEHHSNPNDKDTDKDKLDDYDEVKHHGTKPDKDDTDDDGVQDGKELDINTDPTQKNDSFDVDFEYKPADPDEEEDIVKPFIKIEGLGPDQAGSITIEKDDFFSKDMLGYMGQAYKYFMEGGKPEHKAEISFKFDKFDISQYKKPWIYVFDELARVLKPVEDTKLDGTIVSTEVEDLGTYILMDRYVYEDPNNGLNAWIEDFEIGTEESVASAVQIVFVVDDSGSMDSNDPLNYSTYDYERLRVARDLIDELPENSQIGIVKFCASINRLTPALISDRDEAKAYLQSTYNGGPFTNGGGSTYMYQGIWAGFDLFDDTVGEDVSKIMVVLSDGIAHDDDYGCSYTNADGVNSICYRDSVPAKANDEGIKLYTVGLGDSNSSAFKEQLEPLSTKTEGKFYLAADASQLSEIYGDIQIKIDLSTDNDKDGLIDYYEKNPVSFSGTKYYSDPTMKDTDGDGLKDGEEIIVIKILSFEIKEVEGKLEVVIGDRMMVIGSVISNPLNTDSDMDGYNDKQDAFPMNSKLH